MLRNERFDGANESLCLFSLPSSVEYSPFRPTRIRQDSALPMILTLLMSVPLRRRRLVVVPPPDAALAPQPLTGIEALFREHAPAIASLGLSMLRNPEEADDLVQDVFLRAWDAIDRLAEPENARPWLITIAVRLARTRLRRRRLTQLLFRPDAAELDNVPATGALPEHRDLLKKLDAALNELPANQQLAWVLRYVHDETIESVARLCGCSVSAVKRRLQAAKTRLFEQLGSVGPAGEGP
jgi:RNA polymerase sigma factor (sigma-70 family)